MKKLIITILLLCLGVASLIAAENIALLTAKKGKVDFTRGTKVLRFNTGELLRNNDEIRTGGESFAAYKFVDGSSTVKVFSNSVVKIVANKDGKSLGKKVTLSKGSICTQVNPQTGTFSVQTPTTVASVKGTGFLSKITLDKQSMFIVTEGTVMLKIFDTTEEKAVEKGNTAIVEADGRFTIRTTTPADLSLMEKEEMDSLRARDNRTMRTKYIEITY